MHMRSRLVLAVYIAGAMTGSSAASPAFGTFGFDTSGMDQSVSPGDDFNAYANGGWVRRTVVAPDQARAAVFLEMQDRALAQVRAILEEAAARPGSKIGDFYASFLEDAAADRKGVAPLHPLLGGLAAAQDKPAFAAFAASLQRQGVDGLFGVSWGLSQMVSPDDKTPEVEVFHLGQGGLGLPDREYYTGNDPKLAEARAAYLVYATKLLTLAGEAEPARRAAAVLAFEGRIAAVHWSRADSREADKIYNRWAPAAFAAKAPGFPWKRYLAGLGLASQPGVLVAQPSAFAGEARLWAETPLPVLKDHQLVRLLDHYAAYLSAPFADASFAFHGAALQGLAEDEPRWRRGANLVSRLMRDDIGQAYVRRHFPPETEAAARGLVRNVVAAWRERIAKVSWMAPATRAKTEHKLVAMLTLVGHTTHWRDYGALTIVRDDLFGNVRRSFEAEYAHQLSKLGRPTERDDWDMTPMRADAEEDVVKNIIILPAAIFQPPFFDPAADAAVNYGAVGSFIGHEISHSFDDQGRKYDATGRLTDLWTAQDVRRYLERTARLVRQYDAYEPIPGQHIQGRLVLGETMADLGGVIVGHRAYQIALAGKETPVLGGFTGEQRFYLGWAQMWRMKYREAALRQQLLSDPHPPGEQRADIVRNRPEWYEAFGVKAGDRLYIAPEQRVDVW